MLTYDYTVLPSQEQITRAMDAIRERYIDVELVETGAEALERLQALIPNGATLMTGSSVTLQEIGFEAQLISKAHHWVNLKDEILLETDGITQTHLRMKSTLADYYLGSVQAIAETGEIVIASGTGSQLPAYAYSSPNVIWVAGVHKIVPTLSDALRRIHEHAVPHEDVRMKTLGYPGAMLGKVLIIERELSLLQHRVRLILVKEPVGV